MQYGTGEIGKDQRDECRIRWPYKFLCFDLVFSKVAATHTYFRQRPQGIMYFCRRRSTFSRPSISHVRRPGSKNPDQSHVLGNEQGLGQLMYEQA